MLCAGCGDRDDLVAEPVDQPDAPTSTSVPRVDLSTPPSADHPDPSVRTGAVANFVDCEHGLRQGGWTSNFGPLDSGASAAEALTNMMANDTLGMPDENFVAAGRVEFAIHRTTRASGSEQEMVPALAACA